MDGFDFKKLDHEVDDLLKDVKGLLQEDAGAGQELPEAQEPAQQEPQTQTVTADQTPEAGVTSADDIHIDYAKFYGETPETDAAQAQTILFQPLTAYEQSRPAYQTAKRAEYERAREQERLQREQERLAREREEEAAMRRMESERKQRGRRGERRPPMDEKAYSEWLYAQGDGELSRKQREAAARFAGQEGTQSGGKPRRRMGWGWKVLILLLALLAAGTAYLHFFWAEQPMSEDGLGARREGCSTILIAGTDKGGYRTDTMMLLSVDRQQKKLSLVSIPRDTLVYCEYSVPKINSAFGFAGGGEEGMKELLRRVGEIIGFAPDGYVLVGLDVFEKLVDLMGGVSFDVPMDMHYSDASQDLNIDLSAGKQKLTGAEAMQLVRFRLGYPTADLGRVDVQRQFVSAALAQWVSVKGVIRAPAALKLLLDASQTDLSSGELVWLAESALVCDRANIQTRTLPGAARDIAGGSYYVLDAVEVAETVNAYCNPYEQGVAVSDLYIRVG